MKNIQAKMHRADIHPSKQCIQIRNMFQTEHNYIISLVNVLICLRINCTISVSAYRVVAVRRRQYNSINKTDPKLLEKNQQVKEELYKRTNELKPVDFSDMLLIVC